MFKLTHRSQDQILDLEKGQVGNCPFVQDREDIDYTIKVNYVQYLNWTGFSNLNEYQID